VRLDNTYNDDFVVSAPAKKDSEEARGVVIASHGGKFWRCVKCKGKAFTSTRAGMHACTHVQLAFAAAPALGFDIDYSDAREEEQIKGKVLVPLGPRTIAVDNPTRRQRRAMADRSKWVGMSSLLSLDAPVRELHHTIVF
jgi:hypothetical protein